MLNHKYKILFINSNSLTFIVFKIIESKLVVFFNFTQQFVFANFAKQVAELLTKASMFLNEMITEIKVIFDESNISKINLSNIKINNCCGLEEAKKIIIDKLSNENCYVNAINIKNLINNNNDISCNCDVFVTKYEKYNYYIAAIKQCHVKVTYASNIYNLLFDQDKTRELFIKIIGNQIIFGQYEKTKLIGIKTIPFNFDYLHTKIAKSLRLSVDNAKTMLTLLDKTIENINEDIKIATNFTPTTLTPNFIRASVLLNEFNFHFTKELDKCFDTLNLSSCETKYFVEADQYRNLIKFLTKHKFSTHQQNLDFT